MWRKMLVVLVGMVCLLIGLHVQSFATGGSESFVHNPEPATLMMLSMGALGLFSRRRLYCLESQ